MSNVPLPGRLKPLLQTILKSGALYLEKFEPTETGTPQGGIISPLLANLTLDGLESEIENSLNSITTSKSKKLTPWFATHGVQTVKKKDGIMTTLNLRPVVCRYADDVVIIGRSKNLMEKHIKPALEKFLSDRGLRLSTEKTTLATIRERELNYLGYTFLYNESWKQNKSSLMRSKERKEGIALVPNDEKEKAIRAKLRHEFRKNQNASTYELIAKINPIIKG